MHRKILSFAFLALLFSCTEDREFTQKEIITAPENPDYEIVHYWNFNNTATEQNLITPTISIGNAQLTYSGNYFDAVEEGSSLNARNNDETGSALRLRNPSGDFLLKMPTTGYRDVIFTFASTRTNNGPQVQKISYSLDGVNFITTGLENTQLGIATTFNAYQYNFTAIPEANDNPNFIIKFTFEVNADLDSGNSRFDNITLDGIPTQDSGEPEIPEDTDLYLFHYWNFNNSTTTQTLVEPNIGNGSIAYLGNYFDSVNEGSLLNSRNGDEAGSALRLRNASGDFLLTIPTNGHKNVKLSYTTTRTGSGSQTQTLFYSIDGINYIQSGLTATTYDVTTEFQLKTFDFTSITSANNNSNFKIKIVFDSASSTAASGNNRIDNLTVEGNRL